MTVPALWMKHRPIAYTIAREYRIPGADREDVYQEALIGLWIAARNFDQAQTEGTFRSFAQLVIRRRLASVLIAALREKHAPLTQSVREFRNDEGEWVSIVDVLPGGHDPAEVVIDRERLARVVAAVDGLTAREREGLRVAVNGLPYARQITGSKYLENAVESARRKLRGAA